jgi:hypothetical protein
MNWPTTLDGWDKLASIIQSLLTSTAVLVGGGWALRRYVIGREGTWNLRLSIEHMPLRSLGDHELVLLIVVFENIGKVVIHTGQKGCKVVIRNLPTVPSGAGVLRADQKAPPILEAEIIRSRASAQDVDRWELEPGCSFRHSVPVVLPREALVEVRAIFYWKDDVDSATARRIIDLKSLRETTPRQS